MEILEIIAYSVIYLIGVLLAYGRITAGLYEQIELWEYATKKWGVVEDKPSYIFGNVVFYSLLSWITFIASVVWYFNDEEKYFLKIIRFPK